MTEQDLENALRQFEQTPDADCGLAVVTQYGRLGQPSQALHWLSKLSKLNLESKVSILRACQFPLTVVTNPSRNLRERKKTTQIIVLVVTGDCSKIIHCVEVAGLYEQAVLYRDFLCVIDKQQWILAAWTFNDIGGTNYFPIEEQRYRVHTVNVVADRLVVGGFERERWLESENCYSERCSWFAFLNDSEEWQNFDGVDQIPNRKAIDCVTLYGSQMLAWDNMILPKFVIDYDVSAGVDQTVFERIVELPRHGLNEHIRFAKQFSDFAVYFSVCHMSLASRLSINIVDTVTLNEAGSLLVEMYPHNEMREVHGFACDEQVALFHDESQLWFFPWRKALEDSFAEGQDKALWQQADCVQVQWRKTLGLSEEAELVAAGLLGSKSRSSLEQGKEKSNHRPERNGLWFIARAPDFRLFAGYFAEGLGFEERDYIRGE